MTVLQMLETTEDHTLTEFVADVTSANPEMLPDCFDNRPTWDNWTRH